MDPNPYKDFLVLLLYDDNKIKRITPRELGKYGVVRDHYSVRNVALINIHDELVFFTNTGNIFTIPGKELRVQLKRNISYRCDALFPLKNQEKIIEVIGASSEPSDWQIRREARDFPQWAQTRRVSGTRVEQYNNAGIRSAIYDTSVPFMTHLVLASGKGKTGLIDLSDLIERVQKNRAHIVSQTTNANSFSPLFVSWEDDDELVSVRPCIMDFDWILVMVTEQGRRGIFFPGGVDPRPPFPYPLSYSKGHGWSLHPQGVLIPDGDKVCAVAAGIKTGFMYQQWTNGQTKTYGMEYGSFLIGTITTWWYGPTLEQPMGGIRGIRRQTPKDVTVKTVEISPGSEPEKRPLKDRVNHFLGLI